MEKIVEQLEDGELGLEDAIAKYEQGAKLLARCREALARAEQKIEMLREVTADGEAITEPFENGDDDANDGEQHLQPEA